MAFVCMVLVACKPAANPETPRAAARRTVITLAVSIQTLRDMCAESAEALAEAGQVDAAMDLAERCDAGTDPVRDAIVIAAQALDSWQTVEDESRVEGKVACAARVFIEASSKVIAMLAEHGVTVPPIVSDALSSASAVTPVCPSGA